MSAYEDGTEIELAQVVDLLRRKGWLIAAATVLAIVAGAVYVQRATPVYEARTSMRVRNDDGEVSGIQILQGMARSSAVETEMEVLRSRSLAEDVVDSLSLQLRIDEPHVASRSELIANVFVERWAPAAIYVLERGAGEAYTITDSESGEVFGSASPAEPAAIPGATFTLRIPDRSPDRIVIRLHEFRDAVTSLGQSITVTRPNREASIVDIRYEGTDTQAVRMVPDLVTQRFIARDRTARKTEARSTVTFLEQQIDTLSRQLALAEEALTTFREGEQVVSLQAEAQAQVTQLARLQADRNTLEAERAALQSLVTQIEQEARTADPTGPSPFTRLISFPSLFRNQAASDILRTLNEANSERSELLRRRTLEDPDVQSLTQRIRDIEQQLQQTARTYLQGLGEQVRGYDRTLAQFGSDLERIPAKEVQLARLQRQQTVLEEVYTLLQNRLQEARVVEAIEDPVVEVVDPAIAPDEPIRPRGVLILLLSAFLGVFGGVAVAVALEFLDDTVHTQEDLQAASDGAAVLGIIPSIKAVASSNGTNGASAEGTGRLVTSIDPRSPAAEAYRGLRTNLTFANPDDPARSIVVTSAFPRDGKSTTAANLAITLLQQGSKVLLVDGDLRRGVLSAVLGVAREPGLTNVLAGKTTLVDALHEVDLKGYTLHFLSSGTYPPNPSEVLGSQRMAKLLRALEEQYDLVIFDSAPLTAVTDAAVLGAKADGVILVARANETDRGAVAFVAQQLANVRARLLGTVLNDVDFRRDGRSGGYGKYGLYSSYYYEPEANGKRTRSEAAPHAID